MPKGGVIEDEWTELLSDGALVKFTAQEVAGDGAFFTAQIAGHHVIYSVLLSQARGPFNRDEVERSFTRELSLKKMFRLNQVKGEPIATGRQAGVGERLPCQRVRLGTR